MCYESDTFIFYAIGNCVLLHKKRSAKEAHLAEMKLVINDTARARKSPTSGLFFTANGYVFELLFSTAFYIWGQKHRKNFVVRVFTVVIGMLNL